MAARKGTLRAVSPDEKPTAPAIDPSTPWGVLGFATERAMLLADLKSLDVRVKSEATTATAVAALSKRKQEVFEQIKKLDLLAMSEPESSDAVEVQDAEFDASAV